MTAFIGSHIPKNKKGVEASLLAVEGLGANCFQLFISPTIGKLSDKSHAAMMKEAGAVRKYLTDHAYKMFIHLPYTLNTAKDPATEANGAYWVDAIYRELEIASAMGADGCVMHVGKAVKLRADDAENNMYNSVTAIAEKMAAAKLDTRLFIETGAGQGSELCVSLDAFAQFYNRFSREQREYVGVCVDTAHVWAAGWGMSDARKFFRELDERIGLGHVGVVHFNNSKVDWGARVDRHACLDGSDGGKIPRRVVEDLAQQCVRLGVPMILETPKCIFEVELLWQIAMRRKVQVKYNSVNAAFAGMSLHLRDE